MKRIIVGTDFSKHSLVAMRFAGLLAARSDTAVTVAHVANIDRDFEGWRLLAETPDDIETSLHAQRAEKLEEVVERVFPQGAERPPELERVVLVGDSEEELVALAERQQAAMIVVGTTGEGRLREFFLGSTARSLISPSEVPVMVVPPEQPIRLPKTVLAPIDITSGLSDLALRTAATIAHNLEARFIISHCFLAPSPAVGYGMADLSQGVDYREIRAERERQLHEHVAALSLPVEADLVELRDASPDYGIVEAAEEHVADLIVMGTHARRGLSRALLGNTAERILRNAPCAVLTVRPPQQQESAAG